MFCAAAQSVPSSFGLLTLRPVLISFSVFWISLAEPFKACRAMREPLLLIIELDKVT
jgi:hypothetical protein